MRKRQRQVNRYVRAVGSYLPCAGKHKKQLLTALRSEAEAYCAETRDADLEARAAEMKNSGKITLTAQEVRRGLVAEGTGNGTLHAALEAALRTAQSQGVAVLRASRCWAGGVVGQPEGALPSAGLLTPAKARLELMLQLLLQG